MRKNGAVLKFRIAVALLVAATSSTFNPANGQSYLTQIGIPPFATILPVEKGSIDASNGNLHLEVPLGSFPQRGSRPYVAALVYDSRIWSVQQSTSNFWTPLLNVPNSWAGWRLVLSAAATSSGASVNIDFCNGEGGLKYTYYDNFYWAGPDGTVHNFPNYTQKDPNNCFGGNIPSDAEFASDATGYYMSVTNYTTRVVYAPDGTQVYPTLEDTNGNILSTIDTLGRTPVTTTTNCNGHSYQVCYAVLNSQGNTSTFTVTTESISVNTAFGQSGVTEYSGTLTAVQSIQLPDGTSYQFTYDSGTTSGHYGELSSMTLPTTGQITYGYTNYQDSYGNKNRWINSRVSGGGTWSYTPAVITTCGTTCSQKVTVTKPSTDTIVYTFTLSNGAWRSSVQTYTGSTTLLSTVSNAWDFGNGSRVRLLTTNTTLPTPGGNNITSQTKLTYADTVTMNVSSIKSWKFYAGSSPTFPTTPDRETDITYHATFGNNITDRVTQTTAKDSGGNVVSQTNLSYDDSGSLSNSTPATGIQNHDDTNYSLTNTVRGNLTSMKRCTNLANCTANYIQSTKTYDTTGQVLSTTDPSGNITTFAYTDEDHFYNDTGDGPSHPPSTATVTIHTNAYVKTVTPPISALATMFGYYYGTGQMALVTDANNQTTYSHFFDPFSRPTSAVLPNTGWTYTAYNSSETRVDSYMGITGAFATSGCTGCRQDEVLFDNLGRTSSQELVSDPENPDYVVPTYDTNGRILNATHPYRATSDSTYGLETPTYDGLNRINKLTHQDTTFSQTLYGAAVSGTGVNTTQLCSSSTYGLGFPVLFIDEAGEKREVWVDGFGRTIEGDEPDSSGNLTSNTCYSYDSLGNHLQIAHGSQTRTYGYDVLSRINSVTIPELSNSSGTNCAVTYTYDNNSNVQTRTAPAPNVTPASCTSTVTTTYYHDALNRLTKITYSATSPVTTPTVQYGYDNNSLNGCTTTPPTLTDSNPKGRMTSMCDGSGATSWAHDAAGKIVTEKRTIQGTSAVTQILSYSYNLDGSIATVTYPSGKTITYTVSNAQRFTAAKDTANSIQFATAASYSAPGGLSGVITGQINGGFAGISETHNYNNSLEYTSTKATSTAGTAMDLTVNYATSGDNGSMTSITNNADNGRTQNLTYDPLNRIASATTQATSGTDCWGQNFAPDPLANLNTITSAQCSSNTLSVTVDGNNHIQTTGFGYDAAGNMLQDGSGTGYSYSFDAENRLVKATGMTGGPYCYVYDGNGLRVAKKSGANSDCTGGTVQKLYWRALSGDALAETDGSGSTTNAAYAEYVFFVGRRIASRVGPSNGNSSIFYYFVDQLGSVRTITTGSGSGQTPGQLCYDVDFTPYGQEMQHTERLQTTACPPNYRFTGYEYDSETGLSYAFARYYSPRLGRFLSTDPLGGSVGNLQSHNAYAYVLNNPTNGTDPLGLCGPVGGNLQGGARTPCADPDNPYPGGGGCSLDGCGNGLGDPGCYLNGSAVGCNTLGPLLSNPNGVTTVEIAVIVNVSFVRPSECDQSDAISGDPGGGCSGAYITSFGFHQYIDVTGQVLSSYFDGPQFYYPPMTGDQFIRTVASQARPTVCGGGYFVLRGRGGESVVAHGGAYAMFTHDSRSGNYLGYLVEAGFGPFSGGHESAVNVKSGESESSNLLLVGLGDHFGGFVAGNSDGTQIGGYGEAFGRGGGLYVNIFPAANCH